MPNPVTNTKGTKYWFNEKGDVHRENRPAIEEIDGSKYWVKNNRLHREDGPAVERADGTIQWFLNDKEYTKDEFRVMQFAKGIDCVYPSN